MTLGIKRNPCGFVYCSESVSRVYQGEERELPALTRIVLTRDDSVSSIFYVSGTIPDQWAAHRLI